MTDMPTPKATQAVEVTQADRDAAEYNRRFPDGAEPAAQSQAEPLVPSAADNEPYWDYDERECWNCGGEGFTYGCSWDWQCDTYDEGEGTCLCTRRCDFCNPAPVTPETEQLRQLLADALKEAR